MRIQLVNNIKKLLVCPTKYGLLYVTRAVSANWLYAYGNAQLICKVSIFAFPTLPTVASGVNKTTTCTKMTLRRGMNSS